MTCSECQLQIFDLDGPLDREALVHLSTCGDCRSLDREVRLNATALASLRDEVVPVRPPRRVWPWAVVAAAAILAIVLAIPRQQPAPAPVAIVTPPPAPIVNPVPSPAPAPKPVATHHPRAAKTKPQPEPTLQAAKAPEQPLLVKFHTADPGVVIYWIVDPIEKGE